MRSRKTPERLGALFQCCASALGILASLPSPSRAAWLAQGNPVCTEVGSQGLRSHAVSDGSGTFIVWMDQRRGVGMLDLYAQKLDLQGNPLWTVNGVPVCVGVTDQPQMILDGNGGVIIVWTDGRVSSFEPDVYAQRLNASGAPQWGTNGVPVCVFAATQWNTRIVSDGLGGVIVVWEDNRNSGTNSSDIYAQRLNASGATQWLPSSGVPICARAGLQIDPRIAKNEAAGGAIVTWRDDRTVATTSADIYASSVTINGALPWTVNGVLVCTDSLSQTGAEIVSDGGDGAIIAWVDARGTSQTSIYAQRLSGAGLRQWTPGNGIAIADAPGVQAWVKMAIDGSGGAVISWLDARTAPNSTYAQRINHNGNTLWDGNGNPVVVQKSDQETVRMSGDGAGGAVFAWHDLRFGSTDVFAQRINASGVRQWALEGLNVKPDTPLNTFFLAVTSDGSGGAIVAWEDARNHATTSWDVYAQHVTPGGLLPTDVEESVNGAGIAVQLRPSLPNPFSKTTRIEYALRQAGPVTLGVYDVRGRRVALLADEIQDAGRYVLSWDGQDASHQGLPAGVYAVRLETAQGVEIQKVTLLR